MAVDPQISLDAGTGSAAPQNPLNTVNQFAQTQNALNQTRLFPLLLQQQQYATNQAQLQQNQARQQAVGRYLAPLLSQPNVTHADVMGALGGLKASGIPTDEFESAAADSMPLSDGPELRSWLQANVASRIMSPDALAASSFQNPTVMNNGQSLQPGTIGGPLSATPGAFTPAGQATQVYPSRGELAGRIPGPPGPGGAPTTIPLAAGTPPALSGINLGSGGYNVPPALRNPNGPAIPPPAGTPLPGQISTGLGPAQTNAMATTGAQAAQRFQDISDAGTRARSQDALLANMQNDLTRFGSGTGAGGYLDYKRFLSTWGAPVGATFGIDPGKISAQEFFDKLANQLADAQGVGSDARLAVNQGANPNSGLSPEGADFIIRQLRGNTDYLRARQMVAAGWPDKGDVQGFENGPGQALDPRYFQFNRLTPDQQRTYFTGIKSQAERDAFKTGYLNVKNQGLLAQ